MITSSLILIALFIVNVIVGVFPESAGFPADVTTAVSTVGGYLGILDPVVPISTMATIIALIVTFELIIFAFKGFKWVFSHVPWIGGRG